MMELHPEAATASRSVVQLAWGFDLGIASWTRTSTYNFDDPSVGEGSRSGGTRMKAMMIVILSVALASIPVHVSAQEESAGPAYDAALAERLGADERGMRQYVLVILKTGPTRVPDGEERQAMFAGHFANIKRLSDEGKLALAGPFGKNDSGWRGLYLFATDDVEEARRLTETDPVIVKGEMVAEYHGWYGSAAAMLIPEMHPKLTPPQPPQ